MGCLLVVIGLTGWLHPFHARRLSQRTFSENGCWCCTGWVRGVAWLVVVRDLNHVDWDEGDMMEKASELKHVETGTPTAILVGAWYVHRKDRMFKDEIDSIFLKHLWQMRPERETAKTRIFGYVSNSLGMAVGFVICAKPLLVYLHLDSQDPLRIFFHSISIEWGIMLGFTQTQKFNFNWSLWSDLPPERNSCTVFHIGLGSITSVVTKSSPISGAHLVGLWTYSDSSD